MEGNQHIPSDRNETAGDRPIRNNFNGIIITVLALMAVALLAAWLFIGVKGHKTLPAHDSSPTPTSSTQ